MILDPAIHAACIHGLKIVLIAWSVLSVPAAFICWCVCRVSGMCSRDEEKRGEQ